jgi:hypothetical protein
MLRFYIISTIISIVIIIVCSKAMLNKAKCEGVASERKKYSIAEKMQRMIPLLIPIFNIFLALIFIFCEEELYKRTFMNTNKGECQE